MDTQSQLCMFCGEEIAAADLTMEHLAPKGLWEKGHRPSKMKTLPAHKACNQAFSDDNEYFRDVMAMEEGAQRNPEAVRVGQGAVTRKFSERPGSIVKTLKTLSVRRVRTPSGLDVGRHPTFEPDWPRIERVLRNVVKGIFYVIQGRRLPDGFVVFVADVRFVKPDWLAEVASHMVPWQGFGDAAFCCRYVVSSKEPVEKMTCLMQFYEHRLFVGEAISRALLGADGQLFVPARDGSRVLVPRWAADR